MVALPSPAPSPSLENMTRKRMRSSSNSSYDSATSNKRAVSEVPSTTSDTFHNNGAFSPGPDRADSLARLTIHQDSANDIEIDNYMAEQESGASSSSGHASAPLSPQEKLQIIKKLKDREMVDGEKWYVVSHSWYRRWEMACSGRSQKEAPIDESSIHAVDNSDISDVNGNITVTPTEGITVDYIPEQAWEHFEQWYGHCERPISRQVITEGLAQETRLELFPIRLFVHTLVPVVATNPTPPWPPLSVSKKTPVHDVTFQAKRLTRESIPVREKMRVWHVQGSSGSSDGVSTSQYPVTKLRTDRARLLDNSIPITQTINETLIETDDSLVVECTTNGEWLFNETPQASRSVTPLFGSSTGTDFFSKLSKSNKNNISSTSDTLATPKPSGFGITRSFVPSSKPPGTTGLVNLGNTCFMNSAIQSLAHEPELTEYFLTGLFRQELNPSNPLGMGGAVAESFGALLSKLWVQNTTNSSPAYSPREFKQVLARFAPSFSGYQQQDAQEFIAFLLDGLHEDLNRIKKKPYVEKPEWEGRGENELVELAKKSWEGYMLRNDSVIVDLFQGQYQSTLVCPECSKVSITFDPFMYLTLPLPVRKKWQHKIYFIPWDLSKEHFCTPVELSQSATIKDMKETLGRWTETNPNNLLTLEIWAGKFYKNLHDGIPVVEIQERDIIVCFELPCNAQQSRNYQRQKDEPLIIPIFHTTSKFGASGTRTTYGSTFSTYHQLFGYPFVIVVSPEDVASVGRLYELVIDRLSRWTANSRDLYTWQGGDGPVDGIVPINSVADSVTEIRETGEVVTIEESDITEMSPAGIGEPSPLRKVGPKPDLFKLILHSSRAPVESCDKVEPGEGPIAWDIRIKQNDKASPNGVPISGDPMPTPPLAKPLIKSGEWLMCEWDVHMQEYYFGVDSTWEHALWHKFPDHIHPEFEAAEKERKVQKSKSLNLEDCLDEFTKEERLGEDDLWYCPRCKKHQQATKKFDIWKVPDILVVHLKRFSSSRLLRDKIDALVDFPIEGLDLESRVGERLLAQKLQTEGKPGIGVDLDEPLLFDLFAVTEHMGGLGGGHYRAYAKNHLDERWYHFDDSHVSQTDAKNSVNSYAYLLFYRRRTSRPLGGKTHEKVLVAKENVKAPTPEVGLPTPPRERSPPPMSRHQHAPLPDELDSVLGGGSTSDGEPSSRWNDDTTLRGYADLDDPISLTEGKPYSRYPRRQASPTSSVEAEVSDSSSSGSMFSPHSGSPIPNFPTTGPVHTEVSRPGQTEPHGDVDDIDI